MSEEPEVSSQGLAAQDERSRLQPFFLRARALRLRSLAGELNVEESAELKELRGRLVVAHLNMVRHLAAKLTNNRELREDLMQVGTIGLIKAIDRFEPERGFVFATYAIPTIFGEMQRSLRDTGWAVRVPRRLQELATALERIHADLAVEMGRTPTLAELASHLAVSIKTIIEAQHLGGAQRPLSLDATPTHPESDHPQAIGERVGTEDLEITQLADRSTLARAFEALDPRERFVLHLRFYERLRQTEIAERLGITPMQLLRLQQRAFARLKELLREPPQRENP